jgi:L-fuculose-phosphate aldolase
MSIGNLEAVLRAELARVSVNAYHRGLVGGTGGNISVRLGDDSMLITPSGVSLGDTTADSILKVNINTLTWEPNRHYIPSKEIGMHAAIYQAVPGVGAVCHCHPPYATAYAVCKMDIPLVTDAAFKQPPMPHVSFSPSGSQDLAAKVGEAARSLTNLRAILLDEHGVITVGSDLTAAYNFMDVTEEIARIAFISSLIPAPL